MRQFGSEYRGRGVQICSGNYQKVVAEEGFEPPKPYNHLTKISKKPLHRAFSTCMWVHGSGDQVKQVVPFWGRFATIDMIDASMFEDRILGIQSRRSAKGRSLIWLMKISRDMGGVGGLDVSGAPQPHSHRSVIACTISSADVMVDTGFDEPVREIVAE